MHTRATLLRSSVSTWAHFSRHHVVQVHLRPHIRRASSHASIQAGTQAPADVNETLHRLGLDPWTGFEVGIEKVRNRPPPNTHPAAAANVSEPLVCGE
jgi:hypothetical protein